MAHKKGQGSVKNGRDSLPKRRGIKTYAGQFVTQSSILVTQCGTKIRPGRFVRLCRNYNIQATIDGEVYFDQSGRRINVQPGDSARSRKQARPTPDEMPAVLDRPRTRKGSTSGRESGSGGRWPEPPHPLKESGKQPRLHQKQDDRVVDRYIKVLFAQPGGKAMPPNPLRKPMNLALVANSKLHVTERALGARVVGDGKSLEVPNECFKFLESEYVRTALAFVDFIRSYPVDFAEGLGLDEAKVKASLPELIDELKKEIPAKVFEPIPHEEFGFGALD